MNPGAYKQIMNLPELKMDTKIELPEGAEQEATAAREAAANKNRPAPPETAGGADRSGPAVADRGGPGGGSRGGPGGASGRGGPGGGGGGFSMSAMVDRMMERYDTNADGKIDKDEQANLSERAKPMIADADTDGDGAISKTEITKATEKMMERFRSGGGGGFGGGRPGGGGE